MGNWGYNPYSISGVITPCITSRVPPCISFPMSIERLSKYVPHMVSLGSLGVNVFFSLQNSLPCAGY